MPNKYSHASVLSRYETRGFIAPPPASFSQSESDLYAANGGDDHDAPSLNAVPALSDASTTSTASSSGVSFGSHRHDIHPHRSHSSRIPTSFPYQQDASTTILPSATKIPLLVLPRPLPIHIQAYIVHKAQQQITSQALAPTTHTQPRTTTTIIIKTHLETKTLQHPPIMVAITPHHHYPPSNNNNNNYTPHLLPPNASNPPSPPTPYPPSPSQISKPQAANPQT
ncbi:hypothetical protein XPA_008100 [Xanthoria parietina]